MPTRWVLICDDDLVRRSLERAILQDGVRELTGRNDGPEVEAYLKAVGLPKGCPYCYAGQWWSFDVSTDGPVPILRTGLASAGFNHARVKGTRTSFIPHVGDLLFWIIPGSIYGHVERIIEVRRGGWVVTIAFNVGGNNARDGGMVAIKLRNIYKPLGRMVVLGLVGFTS